MPPKTQTGNHTTANVPASPMQSKPPIQAPSTGELAVKSFESFISFIVGIAIFGASTFAVLASEIADPAVLTKRPRFGRETARTFIALGWLFFVLAFAVAGFSMSVLTAQRERAGADSETRWESKWEGWGLTASAVLYLLVIGGFLFLSLAVVAYVEVVGWIAVAFASIAGLVACSMLIQQVL